MHSLEKESFTQREGGNGKCWLGSVLLDKMSWHRHQPCKRAGHRMFHHQGLHNSVQEDSCRAVSCRGTSDVPACGDCE